MSVNNPTNSLQALGTTDTVTHGTLYVGNTSPSNPFDISVDKSAAGLVGISVQNVSANPAAGAVIEVIAPAGGADAYTEYVVNTGGQFSVGIDNSASDTFKITTGADPSSGTAAVSVTGAGVVSLASPLGLASGGTAAGLTADNGGIVYSNATTLALLASTATANQPLLSGASGAPGWSTATYPGSTTANRILYSSANNTVGQITDGQYGVLISNGTNVPSWLAAGSTGQVLTATTGAAPSWAAAGGAITVTGQLFTSSGAFTYTPTAGMDYVIVELIGGGGGSGGIDSAGANQAGSGGGGGGAYARFILTAAQVGASLSGSVGAAGTAGASGPNDGGAGGDTTLATAAAWTAGGGGGGIADTQATFTSAAGGAGGTVTTGTGTILATSAGEAGGYSTAVNVTGAFIVMSGKGGDSMYGRGGQQLAAGTSGNTSSAGTVGGGYGAGAGGGYITGTNGDVAGAAGTAGAAIFTEFFT